MMVKKSVLIAIFGIVLLGCESDPVQGGCDEGFVELPGPGPNGVICTLVSEIEAINETAPDPNYIHDSD